MGLPIRVVSDARRWWSTPGEERLAVAPFGRGGLFGLERARPGSFDRFDGYLLRDPGQDGPLDLPARAIHLVEWKDPKPIGTPYPIFFNVGIYRTAAITGDIFARHRDVVAAGGVPWGRRPRSSRTPTGAGRWRSATRTRRLDAGVIQAGSPEPNPSAPEFTLHQNINDRRLSRSFPFYQEVTWGPASEGLEEGAFADQPARGVGHG